MQLNTLDVITIDFETYWSAAHSLTKMPAWQYVMHEDTEVQSVAMKINNGPAHVLFGEQITQAFSMVDWANAWVIGHNNSEFDAYILAWRYRITPAMWGCTQAMARALGYAKTCGLSLKALSSELNIGSKLSLEATNTKGRRLADFTKDEIRAMREYNRRDTELCYKLFNEFTGRLPVSELRLIDLHMRMATEPAFEADRELLATTLGLEQDRKQELYAKLCGYLGRPGADPDKVKDALASTAKFKALLTSLGVEVPTKSSPTSGEPIPALAKNDPGMQDLCEHGNELISLAANARLDAKSTILETRLQRFIELSDSMSGRMPVLLRYYGADTTGRPSGAGKLNQLNMPRIGKQPKLTDALRKSLRAPPGYKVIAPDLSGIELRVNHTLWQEPESVELFKKDPTADLYIRFAAEYNSCGPSEVDKEQRQFAKIAMLALQYGMGAKAFVNAVYSWTGETIDMGAAQAAVNTFRHKYANIKHGWDTCQRGLAYVGKRQKFSLDPLGMCWMCSEGVELPWWKIYYPDLRRDNDGWTYKQGNKRPFIYGGKVVENIVQSLARYVMTSMILRFKDTDIGKKAKLALFVYDEPVYVVHEDYAEEALQTQQRIMRDGVDWWPGLVTHSEAGMGDTYGECEH